MDKRVTPCEDFKEEKVEIKFHSFSVSLQNPLETCQAAYDSDILGILGWFWVPSHTCDNEYIPLELMMAAHLLKYHQGSRQSSIGKGCILLQMVMLPISMYLNLEVIASVLNQHPKNFCAHSSLSPSWFSFSYHLTLA